MLGVVICTNTSHGVSKDCALTDQQHPKRITVVDPRDDMPFKPYALLQLVVESHCSSANLEVGLHALPALVDVVIHQDRHNTDAHAMLESLAPRARQPQVSCPPHLVVVRSTPAPSWCAFDLASFPSLHPEHSRLTIDLSDSHRGMHVRREDCECVAGRL